MSNADVNLSRRAFVKRVFWSGATLALGGAVYPSLIEPRRVQISQICMPVRGLPRAFDGLTVAQLSDLHRSPAVSSRYLARCIDLANSLEPDLIVFTGDYVTHTHRFGRVGEFVNGDRNDVAEFAHDCAGSMSRAQARLGVFASLGNHDHWYDAELVTRAIENAGIPVLRNAHTVVRINGGTLPIVGLGDMWTEGVNFERAFAGVDAPFALILMHNPDTFEHWPRAGSHLILSGHTHGGQVNIPLLGPPLVPSIYGQKYAHGLFQRGDSQMYVNRGVGLIYPPVRFNCPPEISLFHLQSA
jgi:predicted MPP superfamily phosphohydrolase